MNEKYLNEKERLMLANQYRILAAVCPDEAEHYELRYEIVSKGYEREYSSLFDDIATPLNNDIAEFVIEVLRLHRALYVSRRNLPDKGEVTEHDIYFAGFDGNDEIDYLMYAEFYLVTRKAFGELRREDGYNSHSGTIGRYRDMLKQWEKLGKRQNLTAEEIKQVLKAQ